MRRLAARHQAGQPPGLLVTPPLPPTPTPSGTANFLRQKKNANKWDEMCFFTRKEADWAIHRFLYWHTRKGGSWCVWWQQWGCVCVGGGHKCLVQEQEEHVCFPLNATTYRNIRLDKLFTSWEVKREALLCNLGSLHHEMWRYLTLVPKQFVLHTQAPAARSHYVLSQSQAKPAAKPDNQT